MQYLYFSPSCYQPSIRYHNTLSGAIVLMTQKLKQVIIDIWQEASLASINLD